MKAHLLRLRLAGLAVVFSAFADSASADNCQYGSSNAVVPYPTQARPAYLSTVTEPTYGGAVTRIANDWDASCGASCTWNPQTRHHYSKDQPWSADGAVLALLNKLGTPPRIYLDGSSYAPLNYTDHTTPLVHYTDWRWHPTIPYVQIVLDAPANTVYWIDVRYPTASPIRTCSFGSFPQLIDSDGIGQFEGNVTTDGKLVAITKAASPPALPSVFILNMNDDIKGPVVQLPLPNILNHSGELGWTSLSPDGRFLVAKYVGANVGNEFNDELIRVFDVDPVTLVIANASGVATPHTYQLGSGASVPCGVDASSTPLSPSNGWVHPLKHADMMIDGGTPVLIGVNGCTGPSMPDYGNKVGRILRVDLITGGVTRLSKTSTSPCDPNITANCYKDEAPAHHVSCRNLTRPGWAYVTYEYTQVNNKQFAGELVAVKTDSSGSVERLAFTHATYNALADSAGVRCRFDCEPQGVPDHNGGRVVWASNWHRECLAGCGNFNRAKSFVVDVRCAGGCPFVDTWTNSGWQAENSILRRSLTGALSLDAYRLKAAPQAVDRRYRLRVRETGRELTTLDQVRLAFIDHGPDVQAYAMGDRVVLGKGTPAIRVTTASGTDVTGLLRGSGSNYFIGEPGDTLTVALVDSSSIPASIGAGSGELDPFEIDPGEKDGGGGVGSPTLFGASPDQRMSDAAVLSSTGILVQGQEASGGWVTVRKIYPRRGFDRVLVDTLDQGPVRLVFVGRHSLRYVGRVIPIGEPVQPKELELLWAKHSRLGDVRGAVANSDHEATTLGPGETIEFEFGSTSVAEGQVRDFFLVSKGAYQSATFVNEESALGDKPRHFALLQNSPNPFRSRTSIRFQLPVGSMVRIDVLDTQGRRLQTLANRFFTAGYQSVEWNPREAPGTTGPGVYFYQIQSGPFRDRKQMVLLP